MLDLNFLIACVELLSFSKISEKVFYSNEISADHPLNAFIYTFAVVGILLIESYLF